MKELFFKLKGKPYIEISLTSGNMVIRKYFCKDIGARWFVDEATGYAFLIPDTNSEGIRDFRKTVFFYKVENAVPLVFSETENSDVCFTLDAKNRLKLTKLEEQPRASKKLTALKVVPAVIDSRVLASLINAKVVTDLLKPSHSKWEELKYPLMIAAVAACIIGLAMVI